MSKKQCINDTLFYEYMAGSLSPRQRKKIKNHIASCNHCYQSFLLTNEFLKEYNNYEHVQISSHTASSFMSKLVKRAEKDKNSKVLDVIKKAIDFVVTKCWDIKPQAQVAYAYARSLKNESSDINYIKHEVDFEDIKFSLYLQKIDDTKPDIFCLDVRLVQNEIKHGFIRVNLINENNDEKSKLLSENIVSFEPLSYGTYYLSIKLDNQKKGTYNFKIDRDGLHEKKDIIS